MSAGNGCEYLLRTVAVGDGKRSLSTPLTRYYTEAGTPPGHWMGSGLPALESAIIAGDEVTEDQLRKLIGLGAHPVTGEPLGRRYSAYSPHEPGRRRHAVAGYDLTFSIPKSASILWGVADAGTQALIAEAHHAAIADALDFLEREIVATRVGAKGPKGSVAQVEVTGVVAAAFDHFDSRANDPHLHTHVVISNKVRTARDGKWRTIDGAPLHAWVVALSELHEASFSDHLTRTLGVGWERRPRGRDRNPAWEIAGVPQPLVEKFSSRARNIDAATDHLIEEYVARHGHRPRRAAIMKLRQQANLSSRPEKHIHSLADLTDMWRGRTAHHLGVDPVEWARRTTTSPAARLLRADDIPLDFVEELGRRVVTAVGERRSTWRRANLYAEAARQTLGWRVTSTADREAITGLVVDAAERGSLRLTPPELAATPQVFVRGDGTSAFRPKHSTVFSAEHLLAAEDRLLERSATTTAPTVGSKIIDAIATRGAKGDHLSPEQLEAIAKIAASGRVVDLLIGPAGAGKTTAMRALRNAWTDQHGKGSLVGLAPSAGAAAVLAEDLGITCENTAKWLHEHSQGRTAFRKNQLVIIDEATLAGTKTLDEITGHAAAAGAKVLLVGDWAQLQSVEAGGAFAMLADDRDDAPELVDVHRFTHAWEKRASLDLRHGRVEAVDNYLLHDRVSDGDADDMTDAAYRAWRDDIEAGRTSILIADTSHAVRELNDKARTERILTHQTQDGPEASLLDGTRASVGDWVITRKNDRRLRTLRSGWVRNGDRWRVTNVHADGSLAVRRLDRRHGGAVLLPAAYVAEHVDLGYAITAHRAQGVTVDTAHVIVSEYTTKENLYVAMTRGRDHNQAYVVTAAADENHGAPDGDDSTARSVLIGVLANSGAELSAHQTITAEQEAWGSIAQLAAEYETIAAAAQRDRWATLLRASALTTDEVDDVLNSEAFGPLAADLRRAEANGHDIDRALPAAVARHGLGDAQDRAAVLRHRVQLATGQRPGRSQHLIVGLIPEALGAMAPDMRLALDERRDLIEERAQTLADTAVRDRLPWTTVLGPRPVDRALRARWDRALITIAAYRDRYGIDDRKTLGANPESDSQRLDHARALAAIRRVEPTRATLPRTDPAATLRL
ncbi:conjugal transfer protein [Nocardioides cavernaquae]|uniref:Conjugal transfer protein n=2 Tax=Nocardioides cavernaquae TaxID=2321396 RepID=A0A3A5HDG7_9ACTN|nr:conjugal transfer protein [Nocardioides cavernaquae]